MFKSVGFQLNCSPPTWVWGAGRIHSHVERDTSKGATTTTCPSTLGVQSIQCRIQLIFIQHLVRHILSGGSWFLKIVKWIQISGNNQMCKDYLNSLNLQTGLLHMMFSKLKFSKLKANVWKNATELVFVLKGNPPAPTNHPLVPKLN